MNNFKKFIQIFLLAFVIATLVVMLIEVFKVEPTSESDDRSTHTDESSYVEVNFRSVTKFTYDDHDYISFRYRAGTAQIVHDPDCRKCKPIK